NELTFLTEERRGVDGEEHAHGRLVHLEAGQAFGVLEIGDGVSDIEALQTHDGAELAAVEFTVLHLFLAEAFEDHELGYLAFGDAAVVLHQTYVLAWLDGTATYTANGDTTLEAAVVQARDAHLQA